MGLSLTEYDWEAERPPSATIGAARYQQPPLRPKSLSQHPLRRKWKSVVHTIVAPEHFSPKGA